MVTVEGQCYVFGSNQFGQLGNSEGTNRQPQLVRALLNQKVTIVACGDTFTVAGVDGVYLCTILILKYKVKSEKHYSHPILLENYV